MSSLTIALASLGGIVLAGVVAHGAWQARRAGPKRASDIGDAAGFGDGRTRSEPTLDGALHADAGRPASDDGDAAAATAEAAETANVGDPAALPGLPATRRPSRRLPVQLDALIDAFATLALEAPVSGDALLPLLPATRHIGSKLVLVEGRNARTDRWETPLAGERYAELQAGIQLASRTGALNEIEYSEFVQRIQSLAEAVGAAADFPDMLDVMARARELDAFASQHDAQLAVHLHARGAAWSVGYIQQHARRHGFVAGVVPGRLVYPGAAEGAPAVLTLTFDSQAALAEEPDRACVRDITLAFDVPQTEAEAEPFKAWQAAAQALAVGMDAAVVDDNERPLSSEGFASIGAELGQLYATLEARDLAAGSAAARRLFT